MADTTQRQKSSTFKVNKNCPPEREINILLLGQTGVGKSTFINSLANYFVYDTIDDAINNEMQVIIPSSFSFSDPKTFEQTLITIGNVAKDEKLIANGQSCTQQCRSYVFPMGDRNLRLIDTPGLGDTRGSEQDSKNLFEILTYISHYEHLNGICILLRPNEERLTIAFRLFIKQLLHYLHRNASENIVFLFTNVRATLYAPGSSRKLLRAILDEYRNTNQIEVPLSKANTFLLDNETFQCLALHKNGTQLDDEYVETYSKSWDYTVKEYERLLTYICSCPLQAIRDTLSLNEAEQLIRKLARPIAEIMRLIEQNTQLAEEYKQKIPNKKSKTYELPQYTIEIEPPEHPKLVCVSEKCFLASDSNADERVERFRVCQEKSYLNGVIQETINDRKIKRCDVIDYQTGKCKSCGCSWKHHINITYEYRKKLTHLSLNNNESGKTNDQQPLNFIDEHLKNLRGEQERIIDVYKKLSKFLHINAIYPFNDDILEYLQVFALQEQSKNDVVSDRLSKIMKTCGNEISLLKETLENATDSLQIEDIFRLVGTLYRLPIHGQSIREQVDRLKIIEEWTIKQQENFITLPTKASSSKIMTKLREVMSSR